MLTHYFGKTTLTILDSYKITTKQEMKEFLRYIRQNYNNPVLNRTDNDLIREWMGHNLLYELGYKVERTKTVDFEYPFSLKNKIGFYILSRIYMTIIFLGDILY